MTDRNQFLHPRLIDPEYLITRLRRDDLAECAQRCGTLLPLPSVLDFGARYAPYRELFAGKASEFKCADLADQGDTRDIDVVVKQDGRLDLGDEQVNLVLSLQVLEHVPDVDLYLAEAHRVLKPGGRLWLTTHGMWPYHPTPTDFFRWTMPGLKREIEKRFEIDDVDAMLGAPAYAFMIYLRITWDLTRRLNFLQARLLNLLPGPPRWGKQAKGPGRIRAPYAYVGNLLFYVLAPIFNLLMMLAETLTSRRSMEIEAAVFRIAARKSE